MCIYLFNFFFFLVKLSSDSDNTTPDFINEEINTCNITKKKNTSDNESDDYYDDDDEEIILRMEEDDEEEENEKKKEYIKEESSKIHKEEEDNEIEILKKNDILKLKENFRTCKLFENIKKQSVYLSYKDINISFDEARHVYLLHEKSKEFAVSVTGFCKKEIHNNEFNGSKIIRNMKIEDEEDVEFDLHVAKAIEWKYAALFGSLFHAIIEYFFNQIVNGCTHTKCKNQNYNIEAYKNLRLDDTHQYYMSMDKFSQTLEPSKIFPQKPVLPCLMTLEYYEDFVDTVLCYENFVEFFKNNHRFNLEARSNKKEILRTMEQTFYINRSPLSLSAIKYRRNFIDIPFETSIDKIIYHKYGIGTYMHDLKCHLMSFRNVLHHLPINECFDIRPEYIVFSEEHGLAGSVDLTMRMRNDPNNLFVYDWKTCKKIFNSFRRHHEQTSQLFDYACQLHTYANLMKLSSSKYKISLFVVNVTHTDSCIYNVKSHVTCKCRNIFNKFKKPLL